MLKVDSKPTESLLQSQKNMRKKNKSVKGGSTITQQLVKNAFLSRSRSYLRKARELTGALLLDATMSKDSQLTWYFNIVEFGPSVYGISAASHFYFKKNPADLSALQCAELVGILPSPIKWGKSLVNGRPSAFLTKRSQILLKRARLIERDQADPQVSSNADPAIEAQAVDKDVEIVKPTSDLEKLNLENGSGSESENMDQESFEDDVLDQKPLTDGEEPGQEWHLIWRV